MRSRIWPAMRLVPLRRPKSESCGAIRGQFMRYGGGETVVAQIIETPSDGRQMRKPEYARTRAEIHPPRNFKLRHIQGQTCPERLDQCFLHSPERKKQAEFSISARQSKFGAFPGSKDRSDFSLRVVAGNAFLHIHAEAAFRRKCNQPVFSTVADAETDGRRRIVQDSE